MEDLFNYLKSPNHNQQDWRGMTGPPPPPPRPTNWEKTETMELMDSNDYEGLQLSK